MYSKDGEYEEKMGNLVDEFKNSRQNIQRGLLNLNIL